MPVRSKYAQSPIPKELRKTPYPLKPLPSRPAQPVQPVKEPTTTQIKNTLAKFGDYLERNQRAYHKDYPNDTTWEQDLRNIPGRVVSKTGDFGQEQRDDLRSRCRQDPNLIREIVYRPLPIKIETKKQKTHKPQQEQTGRRSRRRRSRQQPQIIYVERR